MARQSPVLVAEALSRYHVATPVGEVEVRLSLPAGQEPTAVVLFIHGMNPAPEVVWEWGCIVEPLRQRKVACVFPNLHSCQRSAPKNDSPSDVLTALEAISVWALGEVGKAPVLVYGKSWGGARALELASRIGAAGLCLACPSLEVENLSDVVASFPAAVLLAWARDDKVIPFHFHVKLLEELRTRPTGATVFAPVEQGGHNVAEMAAGDSGLAGKLVAWPDLALGPLARLVPSAASSAASAPAPRVLGASSPMAAMAADMGELVD